MDIQVNYDYREEDVKRLFDVEALATAVLEDERQPALTEVSINFVDDDTIHQLNKRFRDVDRPTDVLSFECDGDDEGWDEELPEGTDIPYQLGDIFIAVDVAARQAPEYGMELPDEVSLLVVHGLLHLCGYDHMQDDEAEEMEARETVLLSSFWGKPFKRHGLGD